MENFLKKVRLLSKKIENLKFYTQKFITLSNQKHQSVLQDEEENDINEKINNTNDLFKTHADEIKGELELIHNENEGIKEEHTENSFLYETRNSHYQSMSKKFAKVLTENREAQTHHTDAEKEILRTQYLIAKPDASEEEIDELLNSDKGSAVLDSAFALGPKSAQHILDRAKERHTNIKKILKDVIILSELINYLNEMVEKSGIIVDKIEVELTETKVSTQKANKDLEKALESERSTMRLKRIAIVIGIILVSAGILGLGAYVVYTIINQNSSKNNGGNNNNNNNTQN